MNAKVLIKKRDDQGVLLSVQDKSESGVFGPARDVFLTHEDISGLTFGEVMDGVFESRHTMWLTNFEHSASPVLSWSFFMSNRIYQVIGVIWLIVIVASLVFAFVGKSVSDLEREIADIRQDREERYDQCLNQCMAERKGYDYEVVRRQALIEKKKAE